MLNSGNRHSRENAQEAHPMMNNMTDMMGGMMWGMGLVSILVIVLLILGMAALAKYLFK
jgi:predicted lipid-binding transport protein (Tim44 family)